VTDPSFSGFVIIQSRHRQTTDKQHIMTIAELCICNKIARLKLNMDIIFGCVLMLCNIPQQNLCTHLEDTDRQSWRAFFGDTLYRKVDVYVYFI